MTAAELKNDLHKYIVETDDLTTLQKIKTFVQKIRETTFKENEVGESEEKTEIMNGIREAIEELKLVKEGKLKATPIEDLLNEI